MHVTIIGGGLVGSLCACLLGNKGVRVKLFEARDDIRLQEWVGGRSINLALSERGRSALRCAGLEEEVILRHGIPMEGRMIHDTRGRTSLVPYNREKKCIYSVGRRFLNETLLTAAEKNSNVEIIFGHKFLDCDLKTGKLKILSPQGEVIEETSDLVLGCDGAFSAVRRHLLKRSRVQYSQEYIEHGYVELNIPTTDTGEFAVSAHVLHIWPRHTFMLIALPNQDKSFTATLFAPFALFDSIGKSENLLVDFFRDNFPDALRLIGRDKLVSDFFKTPASALVSIKCNPYHVEDRLLLIGDAAHAMVPFYGQGMNAGFEDCEIFLELLEAYSYDLKRVLPAFTERRHEDAAAICDLAMYNYLEMRHLVTSRNFLLRKHFDNFMNTIFPEAWIPLYTMVTFTKLPYSHCIARKQMQDKILVTCFWAIAVIFLSIMAALFTRI